MVHNLKLQEFLMGLTQYFEAFIYKSKKDQNALFKVVLFIPYLLYSATSKLQNFLYALKLLRVSRLPGKTISVGNLTVGGTGKSPVVIEVTKHLQELGSRPAILTRGYKSGLGKNEHLVILGGQVQSSFSSLSVKQLDEPIMISHALPNVPVVVGQRRFQAASKYIEATKAQITHWVLDDGFQHRKLFRDIDLVLIDAQIGFGNCRTLPLGPLREGVGGLSRATAVVLMRSNLLNRNQDLLNTIQSYNKNEIIYLESSLGDPWQPKGVNEKKIDQITNNATVLALCGIASPHRFFSMLKNKFKNLNLTCMAVPDHSQFDDYECEFLRNEISAILTTEKDYYRNPGFFNDLKEKKQIPVYVIPLVINDPKKLLGSVLS